MNQLYVGADLIDAIEPAGLQYCRQHGLSTTYKEEDWLTYPESEQEILIADDTVIWTRGSTLIRAFTFNHEKTRIKQALLVSFDVTEERGCDAGDLVPQLGTKSRMSMVNLPLAMRSTAHVTQRQSNLQSQEEALAVYVGDLLFLYYVDGRRDVINLPFEVAKLYALRSGLLIERYIQQQSEPGNFRSEAKSPSLFHLPRPIVELGVALTESPAPFGAIVYADDRYVVTNDLLGYSVTIWTLNKYVSQQTSLPPIRPSRRSSTRSSLVLHSRDDLEDRQDLTHSQRLVTGDIDALNLYSNAANLRQDFVLRQLIKLEKSTAISVVLLESEADCDYLYVQVDNSVHRFIINVPTGSLMSRDLIAADACLKVSQRHVLINHDGSFKLFSAYSMSNILRLQSVVLGRSIRPSVLTLIEPKDKSLYLRFATGSKNVDTLLKGLRLVLAAEQYDILYAYYVHAKQELVELHALVSVIYAIFISCVGIKDEDIAIKTEVSQAEFDLWRYAISLSQMDKITVFHQSLAQILLVLHFFNLELELSLHKATSRVYLYKVLAQLSHWLRWPSYVLYYAMRCDDTDPVWLTDPVNDLSLATPSHAPPDLLDWITATMNGQRVKMQTIELLKSVTNKRQQSTDPSEVTPLTIAVARIYEHICSTTRTPHDLSSLLDILKITDSTLDQMPAAVVLPIYEILQTVGQDVPWAWQQKHAMNLHSLLPGATKIEAQHISQLFPHDRRLEEVHRLLQSRNITIIYHQFPEHIGEAELVRQQQQLARHVALRTAATPCGAALYYFDAARPLLTQKFTIQPMSFDVRFKPSQTMVSGDPNHMTPQLRTWAHFHIGVNAGLNIKRNADEISASWIVFNKPEEPSEQHAGFLMGLGLNKHLRAMATWHAFNYLTSKHALTSIGLLLGLSASFLGTMDVMITKLLSVHVLALLPVGSNDLNLTPLTQTAGLVGIGLLHFETHHRRMSEILVNELSRQDKSEDKFRDEGYRLAAGWSLGAINIACGSTELNQIPAITRALVRNVQGVEREENDLDNKMPGSIVALGLIYLKTENRDVARYLAIPSTQHDLDKIRPDLLLLRNMMRNIVEWNGIEAGESFIMSQIPAMCRSHSDHQLSGKAMALYNIVAGTCFAIGLKFAGTGNKIARDSILGQLDRMLTILDIRSAGFNEKACKISARTCTATICYAASMIMAGTGDLAVLRRLRRIHHRVGSDVWYGHHMATQMSIGLLFLAGGRHSLGSSNLAIASLIIAFYPVLPNSTMDNASHLQAFRHLWVLATERRCLELRDDASGDSVSIPVRITLRDGTYLQITTPALLPQLSSIARIEIVSAVYMPCDIEVDSIREGVPGLVRKRCIEENKISSPKNSTLDTLMTELEQITTDSTLLNCAALDLQSGEPWETHALNIRAILLAANEDNMSVASIAMLQAYRQADADGLLNKHLSSSGRRLLDDEYMDRIELMHWQRRH